VAEKPVKGEFHVVSNAEADAIVEDLKHAIPHNEWLGRIVRNMYSRLQTLEEEVEDLRGQLGAQKSGGTSKATKKSMGKSKSASTTASEQNDWAPDLSQVATVEETLRETP
jgi:hypothetical protein